MTGCPDWGRLAAAREAGDAEAAWREALAHLDACEACGPRALAAEPTVLFRSLPAVESGEEEVAAMRQAVASLRRASRVAPPARSRARRRLPPLWRATAAAAAVSRRAHRLRRLAAAVALAAASGGLWLVLPHQGDEPMTAPAATTSVAPAAARTPPAWRPYEGETGSASGSAAPKFLDLAAPHAADLYQAGGDEMPVVMVVDETLDV